jgi:hypothetical protein
MERAMVQLARTALVVMAMVSLTGVHPETQGQGQGRRGRQDTPPMEGAMRGPDAARAIRAKHAREGKSSADAESLVRVLELDESAWVTADGQVFFSDLAFHETPGPGGADGGSSGTSTGAPPIPDGYTEAGIPIHHSNPGSMFKLYMDFDGDFLFSPEWGMFGRNLQGYSIDFDRSTFNHQEQDHISRVWGRVAEDFAPFDIDVTTERPVELQRGHPDERNVLWSIFTTTSSAGFPSFVAGVSLFNLGYMPFGTRTPTFTFFNTIGTLDHDMMADVATQENGHMFGLLHDGLLFPSGGRLEYYEGHGSGPTSWGPVMGAPIRRNVTQWSLADYPNGVNPPFHPSIPVGDHQDDIAIIAGKLGFRADDVGDEPSTAAPFTFGVRHYIGASTDADVFALPGASRVELILSGYRDGGITDGGNLDIAAEIVNAAGLVIASVDDHEQTTATLDAEVPPGPHFLRVHASSNPANYTTYASIGEYTVSGRIEVRYQFSGFASPLPAEVMRAGRTVPVKFSLETAAGPLSAAEAASLSAVAELWSNASQHGSPIVVDACSYDSAGTRYHCNLKLPKALAPGQTYWLTARYLDGGGLVLPAGGTNPLAFVVK